METKVLDLGNYNVHFPYDPYPAQKTYMEKVLACLDEKQFGLLESPTGTGKTLALLCASLAWLESNGSQVQRPSGPDADIQALVRGESLPSGSTPAAQPSRCRIVYASRTHSQLAQVIEEFRRCPYNHVSSVILASREQLCINESLATYQDKNQMCKVKRKTKMCVYYNNLEKAADTQPESGIGDIESLKQHGSKRKLCPYYISRDMAAKADIVFLPYNYLVDPRIRKSLAINLDQSVVIIDEAHNILRIFEDSSSASFTSKEIAVALSELDFLLDFKSKASEDDSIYADTLSSMPNFDTSQVYALKDCLSNFEKGIVEFSKSVNQNSEYTGAEVIKIFDSCGVTTGNAALLTNAISTVLDALSVLNLASGANKGKGLASIQELVEMLYLDGSGINPQEKMSLFYRFHIAQVDSKFGSGKDTQYNLWCFHPGFSLTSLVKCNIRSLILTSGTLKPMDSFQTELSAEFSIKLQNDHVINAPKQINYQVVSKGPDGQELISTFQSRSNPKYLTSLGQALVEIAKVVPDGLLVFFPSYAWMDACLNHWKQLGIWERLNHWKQCFVEPKNRSALSRTVEEFRSKVRHVSRIGACFLAVCRGKVSEGIDFADADARAVVITGIPYPSVFDPKVSLKKKFLDSQKNSSTKTLSGTEWYNLEAFRAINQAVGRVIRHKDDFGAVLLLDKRFAFPGNAEKLSSWLPKAQKPNEFKECLSSLEMFFSEHQYFPKPKNPVAKNLVQNLKKRPTPGSSNSIQSRNIQPQKRQKIIIKPRQPLVESNTIQEDTTTSSDSGKIKEDIGATTKTTSSDDSSSKSKRDIQHFVLGLKERLEKKVLKEVILCVRNYKEKGDIKPLAEKLKSLSGKLLPKDIDEFRTFVRHDDDKRIFDALMFA